MGFVGLIGAGAARPCRCVRPSCLDGARVHAPACHCRRVRGWARRRVGAPGPFAATVSPLPPPPSQQRVPFHARVGGGRTPAEQYPHQQRPQHCRTRRYPSRHSVVGFTGSAAAARRPRTGAPCRVSVAVAAASGGAVGGAARAAAAPPPADCCSLSTTGHPRRRRRLHRRPAQAAARWVVVHGRPPSY